MGRLKVKKKSQVASKTSQPKEHEGGGSSLSKLDIDMEALLRDINPGGEDIDARSHITSKSLRGRNLKKKTKRQIKKEFWTKKMNMIQAVRNEVKEKKKREKTVIVGDLKPLQDTLPTLDLLMKSSHTQHKPQATEKPRHQQKEKARTTNMLADVAVFKAVMKHPDFKAAPQATITEHLLAKQQRQT